MSALRTAVCSGCGQRVEVVAGTSAFTTHDAPAGNACSRSGYQLTDRERRSIAPVSPQAAPPEPREEWCVECRCFHIPVAPGWLRHGDPDQNDLINRKVGASPAAPAEPPIKVAIQDDTDHSGAYLGHEVVAAPPERAPDDDRANCSACNYDTHRCPGCGTPVAHGTVACSDCAPARVSEPVPPAPTWTVERDRLRLALGEIQLKETVIDSDEAKVRWMADRARTALAAPPASPVVPTPKEDA